jgi:hypothetical protein
MRSPKGASDHPSYGVEAIGWLAFLMFVAVVYALKQLLDRPSRGR